MRKVMASLFAVALVACTERPLHTARDMAPPPLPGATVPAGGALVIPNGYDAQPITNRLDDPRALLFDPAGRPLVLEGGPARLSRVESDGSLSPLAQGGGNGPWSGAAMVAGRVFVAEAGGPLGGRVLEIKPGGAIVPLPTKLPGGGLVGPMAAGPDGWLHVGIASAAATGGGGGGDIPCQDSRDQAGRRVDGKVPCTGAVLRLHPDTGQGAIHSWGWRAPAALGFAADGRLLVADRAQAAVELHQAIAGLWYGRPESQLAATDPAAIDLPNPPPSPLARIDGTATALAATDRDGFGGADEVFMALTPAGSPGMVAFTAITGGIPVPFAANLHRPQALAFSPGGDLWVADAGTGTLWRIRPYAAPVSGTSLPPAPPSATSVPNRWRPPAWTIRAWGRGGTASPWPYFRFVIWR
jgi:glucose/arabinose dehydrogenase